MTVKTTNIWRHSRSKRFLCLCLLLSAAWALAGCTGLTTAHIDPDEVDRLGAIGPISSQDFRRISFEMAQSLVRIPQIQNANNPPTIAFTEVANASDELFSTDDFLYKMRTELVESTSGRIVFLDRDIVEQILREKAAEERGEITPRGNKPLYRADYFLAGRVESIRRTHGREQTLYMRVSFWLTDASTSASVWEADYELKEDPRERIAAYDGSARSFCIVKGIFRSEYDHQLGSPVCLEVSMFTKLLSQGDSCFLTSRVFSAIRLYRLSVNCTADKQQIRQAAWRLLFCAHLSGDTETAQLIHGQHFSGPTDGDYAYWIDSWLAGKCPDDEFPQRLEKLIPGSGQAIGWFLVGERHRGRGDDEAARAAFRKSADCQSSVPTWGSRWAKVRLEETPRKPTSAPASQASSRGFVDDLAERLTRAQGSR